MKDSEDDHARVLLVDDVDHQALAVVELDAPVVGVAVIGGVPGGVLGEPAEFLVEVVAEVGVNPDRSRGGRSYCELI